MQLSIIAFVSFLTASTLAGPLEARDQYHDSQGGLKRICPGIKTMEKGCVRCKQGPHIPTPPALRFNTMELPR